MINFEEIKNDIIDNCQVGSITTQYGNFLMRLLKNIENSESDLLYNMNFQIIAELHEGGYQLFGLEEIIEP